MHLFNRKFLFTLVRKGWKMMKKKMKNVKSKKDPPIKAFDLEFSGRNDLRNYVARLEKELECLRKDRAFYSANKDKLVELLETTRKASLTRREESMVENSAADQFVEQLRRFPVNYNERRLIANREKVRMKSEKVFDDFVERSTAEADHLDEEQFLKQQIADYDKLTVSDVFRCRMSVMDMKETYQITLEDMDRQFSKKLESALHRNLNSCLKANKDFNSEKLRELVSIWDLGDIRKDTYINEIRRMQDFFHKISSSNSEIIHMLGQKLDSLTMQSESMNINLQQMQRENAALKAAQSPARPLIIRRYMTSIQDTKKLDKLKYRNEVLAEILRMAKANLQNLKEQLIRATRKIYQTADFKAHVLEELIRTNLLMESEEEETKEVVVSVRRRDVQNEQKGEKEDCIVNLINLRLENSDTLFVPPIYHDLWNPSE